MNVFSPFFLQIRVRGGEENFALSFDPSLPRKDNVKEEKLMKIINFVKFFKIFSLKLFLIIQGYIFPGFLLQIHVYYDERKFLLYNFPMVPTLLPYQPNDF